jgi:undecaprenyl-diphosphatase
MPEGIYNIDKWLFHLLNTSIANSLFDAAMPYITSINNWWLVYFFLFGWLLWKGGMSGRICALTLIITILISDQLNSFIIKEIFERLRPCANLEHVRLLVPCPGGHSFPSSHATNNFAAAIVLSKYFPYYKWLYFSIAALIAFSRVYIGVHYPSDIIGGAFLGLIIGYGVYFGIKSLYALLTKKS